MTTDEIVGANVHAALWRRRIPQQRVYVAMGLSRSALAKRLRGQTGWSVDDLLTAARALNVPVTDLLPADYESAALTKLSYRPAPSVCARSLRVAA